MAKAKADSALIARRSIQEQKEALIAKAIEAKGFSLDNEAGIKENFSISEYPDGSSNIMFRDEKLIHFFPLETKEIERNEDIVIQFNQPYKILYQQ